MQYAEVAVATRVGHRESLLTYEIPPSLLPQIALGIMVEVPFRSSRTEGIVVSLTRQLPRANLRGRLKPIGRVLFNFPILNSNEIKLRLRLAELLFQPAGLTITRLLPPRSLAKLDISLKPESLQIQNQKSDCWVGQSAKLMSKTRCDIQMTLENKQSVLILAPTQERVADWQKFIEENFPDQTSLIFSPKASTVTQNLVWQAVLNQSPVVIIGTRSAVFLPFTNLGLIAIDQPSHRQFLEEQAPYYHAFIVARLRQKLMRAKIIVIDSLPPLEIFCSPEREHWRFRRESALDPTIRLLTRKSSLPILPTTESYLRDTFLRGERIIFVVAKRGWASALICKTCGELVRCGRCAHLAVIIHEEEGPVCPVCHTQATISCRRCAGNDLKSIGWGTDRWLQYLRSAFSQISIANLTLGEQITKTSQLAIITPVQLENYFGWASGVVLIEPEKLLTPTDYRATERWYRFLWHAKWAARKTLLIETSIPDHPIFSEITAPIPQKYLLGELKLLKSNHYPPYAPVACIQIFRHTSEESVAAANKFAQITQKLGIPETSVLGPSTFSLSETKQTVSQILIKIPKGISSRIIEQLRATLPRDTRFEITNSL